MQKWVFSLIWPLALLLSVIAGQASAEQIIITEKDLKFSTPMKVIHPGDKVIFQNNDNVSHNIVSLTPEFKFDLGVLASGQSKSVTFKEKGVADVQCTIHPGMKMTLFVF